MNLKGKIIELKCTKCDSKMGMVVMASAGSTHQWIQSSYCPTCYAVMLKGAAEKIKENETDWEENDWEEHYGDHSEG